ncbi:hypothetical protein ACFLZN_01120 [Nanoarchaeota archaeon]
MNMGDDDFGFTPEEDLRDAAVRLSKQMYDPACIRAKEEADQLTAAEYFDLYKLKVDKEILKDKVDDEARRRGLSICGRQLTDIEASFIGTVFLECKLKLWPVFEENNQAGRYFVWAANAASNAFTQDPQFMHSSFLRSYDFVHEAAKRAVGEALKDANEYVIMERSFPFIFLTAASTIGNEAAEVSIIEDIQEQAERCLKFRLTELMGQRPPLPLLCINLLANAILRVGDFSGMYVFDVDEDDEMRYQVEVVKALGNSLISEDPRSLILPLLTELGKDEDFGIEDVLEVRKRFPDMMYVSREVLGITPQQYRNVLNGLYAEIRKEVSLRMSP